MSNALRSSRFLAAGAVLSAVIAIMRREPPFDATLDHWDETVSYAAICALVRDFN